MVHCICDSSRLQSNRKLVISLSNEVGIGPSKNISLWRRHALQTMTMLCSMTGYIEQLGCKFHCLTDSCSDSLGHRHSVTQGPGLWVVGRGLS